MTYRASGCVLVRGWEALDRDFVERPAVGAFEVLTAAFLPSPYHGAEYEPSGLVCKPYSEPIVLTGPLAQISRYAPRCVGRHRSLVLPFQLVTIAFLPIP